MDIVPLNNKMEIEEEEQETSTLVKDHVFSGQVFLSVLFDNKPIEWIACLQVPVHVNKKDYQVDTVFIVSLVMNTKSKSEYYDILCNSRKYGQQSQALSLKRDLNMFGINNNSSDVPANGDTFLLLKIDLIGTEHQMNNINKLDKGIINLMLTNLKANIKNFDAIKIFLDDTLLQSVFQIVSLDAKESFDYEKLSKRVQNFLVDITTKKFAFIQYLKFEKNTRNWIAPAHNKSLSIELPKTIGKLFLKQQKKKTFGIQPYEIGDDASIYTIRENHDVDSAFHKWFQKSNILPSQQEEETSTNHRLLPPSNKQKQIEYHPSEARERMKQKNVVNNNPKQSSKVHQKTKPTTLYHDDLMEEEEENIPSKHKKNLKRKREEEEPQSKQKKQVDQPTKHISEGQKKKFKNLSKLIKLAFNGIKNDKTPEQIPEVTQHLFFTIKDSIKESSFSRLKSKVNADKNHITTNYLNYLKSFINEPDMVTCLYPIVKFRENISYDMKIFVDINKGVTWNGSQFKDGEKTKNIVELLMKLIYPTNQEEANNVIFNKPVVLIYNWVLFKILSISLKNEREKKIFKTLSEYFYIVAPKVYYGESVCRNEGSGSLIQICRNNNEPSVVSFFAAKLNDLYDDKDITDNNTYDKMGSGFTSFWNQTLDDIKNNTIKNKFIINIFGQEKGIKQGLCESIWFYYNQKGTKQIMNLDYQKYTFPRTFRQITLFPSAPNKKKSGEKRTKEKSSSKEKKTTKSSSSGSSSEEESDTLARPPKRLKTIIIQNGKQQQQEDTSSKKGQAKNKKTKEIERKEKSPDNIEEEEKESETSKKEDDGKNEQQEEDNRIVTPSRVSFSDEEEKDFLNDCPTENMEQEDNFTIAPEEYSENEQQQQEEDNRIVTPSRVSFSDEEEKNSQNDLLLDEKIESPIPNAVLVQNGLDKILTKKTLVQQEL